jgi:SP family sugar:H+ symporter-like MFS transporter
MNIFNRDRGDHQSETTAVPSHHNSMDSPQQGGTDLNSAEFKKDKKSKLKLEKVPNVTLRTAVMAILVAMGGFIFGYDTGQISGFLEMDVFLQMFGQPTAVSDKNPSGFYFTNVRSGLIVALVCYPSYFYFILDITLTCYQLSIGTLVGCLIAGPLANKFGRKWCIPVWCLIFCLGVVIQMAVGQGMWVGIVMGRWVAGLGVGALSVLVPLYMAEASPVPVRGSVIS